MKLEELQAEILRLNKQTEDYIGQLKAKDELILGLQQKNEENATKISDYQEKIMTLRDMNTDLFLRVSQPIPQPEEEVVVEEPVQTLDDITSQW